MIALLAGIGVLAAVVLCLALALTAGVSTDPARGGQTAPGAEHAVPYGVSQTVAFAAYITGLWFLRRLRVGAHPILVLALMIQLVPLAAPLLTSSDAWTYWSLGRINSVYGGNPYLDPPNAFPNDISLPLVPPEWRGTTTPYGPFFTLASQGVASLAGVSPDGAALVFRAVAAAAVMIIVVLVSRLASNGAFAAAFVGWNPIVALNFAGAGHNDALMMLFVVGAIALAERRPQLAGGAWGLAVFTKLIPLMLLPLYLLERRARGRPLGLWGLAVVLVALACQATLLYGTHWVASPGSVLGVVTRQGAGGDPTSEALGAPRLALFLIAGAIFAIGYIALLVRARQGRAQLGTASTLLLFVVLVSPQTLWPWYLLWAIPLVAIEEGRWPQLAVLALCAYELNFLGDAGTLLALLR